jgi:hypothetical protein
MTRFTEEAVPAGGGMSGRSILAMATLATRLTARLTAKLAGEGEWGGGWCVSCSRLFNVCVCE